MQDYKKPHPIAERRAFYTRMKKTVVTFRVKTTLWTMRWRQWNRWSYIATLTPEARRRFAVPNYLFAASFGSRCSAQAWKKESLELGLPLQKPCVRSTPNISPDYVAPRR
jgi:hypothetical protein